ncbi:hypothetical protein [Burkholderia sp. WSM2232]|uniref:hypothetical protein n=1 Tax=Burkholderia sp. WSM2232 TaxID=944436 RepID=UPI00068824F3|nr:hypothetical protein [Burkholderia sp. WSM2232]
MSDDDWRAEPARVVADPEAWLTNADIAITPQRVDWARAVLENQPLETIRAMAIAVVAGNGDVSYLQKVCSVIQRGTPLFLLAGERSASGRDLPDCVKTVALDCVIQKNVGHMMMLEQR